MSIKKTLTAFLALIMIISLVLSGCSKSNQDQSINAPKESSVKNSDPLGKYDSPIELTTVRFMDLTNKKFPEGDSLDNNKWYRAYSEELGINVKNLWIAPPSQQEQKVNLMITSNELPDFFEVNANQLKQLIEANKIEDMTQYYNDYATPLTKNILTQSGDNAIKSASSKGKIMGIPKVGSSVDTASMIWVRTDWLKKLNLPAPKTMNDVFKIAEAFTTMDPDSNGQDDTYGFSTEKDFNSLQGFFNAYHSYPNIWIKDSSNNLVYGSIQPEMKIALKKLQDLYSSGQIDKEFGSKDWLKFIESANSGKFGIIFGRIDISISLQAGRNLDHNMDWMSYPLPSIDDKPAIAQTNKDATSYYVVRKGVKSPEALIKLINFHNRLLYDSSDYSRRVDFQTFPGTDIYILDNAAASTYPNTANIDQWKDFKDATQTKDYSKLSKGNEAFLKNITDGFKAGDDTFWGLARAWDENGSFRVISEYNDKKLFMPDLYYGPSTQTMLDKMPTLKTNQENIFTKIILGQASIDEFDKFVSDWKRLGGDEITKEVNEWNTSK